MVKVVEVIKARGSGIPGPSIVLSAVTLFLGGWPGPRFDLLQSLRPPLFFDIKLFGVIWDRLGSSAAFLYGATLAVVAAMGMALVVPSAGRGHP